MYVYHGMCHESYISMLHNGFDYHRRNWTCSNPNHMYFWKTPEDCENYNQIYNALTSGTVDAALHHSTSENLYVLRLNIPDDEIDDFPDLSAPNMEDAIAMPKNLIENYDPKVIAYEHVYTPSLGLFYLAWCCPDYLNTSSLTKLERKMLTHLRKQNVYLDELYDVFYYD